MSRADVKEKAATNPELLKKEGPIKIMNELVSIVVPVYNMGDSIEKCVESICRQDYTNIEIILVDDGSKDDSYSRCLKLAEKDPRITVFHTENRGSGPARNTGIQNAKGRYIYFPDADDYMEPNAVSVMLAAMENGKYDLVVFGYKNYNQDGKLIHEKYYEEMSRDGDTVRADYVDYMGSTRRYGIQGAPWNKFFDLNVVKQNHVEFPPLRRHQDEGFIARYMCQTKNIHFIKDALYIHYVNDLKKEWQKYPTDYIDVVIGLYETRKETILTWNPNDSKTHEFIENEYICNVIKALELSYSPKMNLTSKERKKWIVQAIQKARLAETPKPEILGKYQRKICDLINAGQYNILVLILHFKVIVEQFGLLGVVKKAV